jgi:hypothetical protein
MRSSRVDGVDHVDAVRDERAFAPTDHLAAGANAQVLAEGSSAEHEAVEALDVLADAVLGRGTELVVVGVLEVVEAGARPKSRTCRT